MVRFALTDLMFFPSEIGRLQALMEETGNESLS